MNTKHMDIKVLKQPSFRELRNRLWIMRSKLSVGVLAEFATYYNKRDNGGAKRLVERLEHEYDVMMEIPF